MNKTKVHYRLSKTEFLLISALLIVALIAVGLTYMIFPAMDRMQQSKTQYEQETRKLQTLMAENTKLTTYVEQDQELSAKLSELQKRIPAYYSQEEAVAMIDRLSGTSGLKIVSVGFKGVQLDAQKLLLAQLKNEKIEAVDANAKAEPVPAEQLVRSERVEVGFEGTYDQLTQFLSGLEQEPRAVFCRESAMTRAEGGGVTGSVTLLLLSGPPTATQYPDYSFDVPEGGKADPFAAFSGFVEGEQTKEETKASEPDFYLILNTFDDNAYKVLLGKYEQTSSELSSNANKSQKVRFVLSGKGDALNYSYELDGRSFSGTFKSKDKTGSVLLSVLSRSRKNKTDKVSVVFDVVNQSDKKLILNVRNDDASNPRFVLGSTSGSVQVTK